MAEPEVRCNNVYLSLLLMLSLASVTWAQTFQKPSLDTPTTMKEGTQYTISCSCISTGENVSLAFNRSDQSNVIPSSTQCKVVTGDTILCSSIYVFKARREDKGVKVICTAVQKGNPESISDTTTLDVLAKPRSSVSNTLIKATIGTEVTLHCKTDANPPATDFDWSFDDATLNETGSSLILTPTNASFGEYTCIATNTVGTSEPIVFILEQKPLTKPRSNISNCVISADIGMTVNLTCATNANPPATDYQWSFGGVTLNETESSLEITLTDDSLFGEYTCVARNRVGNSDPIVLILEEENLYPPKLTVRNVTETESQQATIICVADGRPDNFYFFPFVHTWKGHVIRHVTGQRVGREYMHVFVSSSYQDSGVYGCAVENGVSDELGEKQEKGNIFVKINGSPKLTVGIRKEDIVEAETGEMVTLFRTFYSSTSITSYTWRKDTKPLNSTRMFDTTVQLDIHGVVVEDKGYNFTLDIGQFDQDEHSGQYSLRVCNSIGCETSTITLKLQVSDMTHPDTGSVAGIVGGCIAGVVTVCLLIAGVVLLYRKGYKCNFCISKTDDDNQKESERRGVDTSPTYSTIDVPDQSERRTQYCSLESTELQQYTGLKLYENTGAVNEAVDDVDSHHDTYEQGSQHAYENTGTAPQNEPT